MEAKIRSFTQLEAWKKGHKLVLEVYKIVDSFPKNEEYGLTSQMKRCVISITSNIAQAFGRWSYKDKIHFYVMAFGSLLELQNQLLIAKDLGFIKKKEFIDLANLSIKDQKLISGLIKKSRTKRF